MFDLVIIGAGPAGLSTAMHLVKSDSSWRDRLVVIEKARHPRAKLCGGGVTRFGLRALRDLGFSLPLPLPQAEVDNVCLIYGDRKINARGKPQFVVFNRSELDDYLAQEARQRGVEIREGEPVRTLKVRPDCVEVRSTRGAYVSQIVVGADGALGLTRKTLRGRSNPKRIARLLEVRQPAPGSAPLFEDKTATFDFSHLRDHLQGYAWDFPSYIHQQPTFNRGVYDSRIAKWMRRADLPQVLEQHLSTSESLEIHGHPLHWFTPANPISGERILLVGDAAGVDPLFGEGIGPALGYGKIAARVIEDAFDRQDFSLKAYKREVLFSPLGEYLWWRLFGAFWVYNLGKQAWFMHILWTACQILAKFWQAGGI